jgi:hypothetical protein
MQLKDFLLSIIGGSVALGPAIFYALNRIELFVALKPEYKRWVVAVAAGVLGVAAWGTAVLLGYVPVPEAFTPNYYAEAIYQFGVLSGFSAFMSATLIHGHVTAKPTE